MCGFPFAVGGILEQSPCVVIDAAGSARASPAPHAEVVAERCRGAELLDGELPGHRAFQRARDVEGDPRGGRTPLIAVAVDVDHRRVDDAGRLGRHLLERQAPHQCGRRCRHDGGSEGNGDRGDAEGKAHHALLPGRRNGQSVGKSFWLSTEIAPGWCPRGSSGVRQIALTWRRPTACITGEGGRASARHPSASTAHPWSIAGSSRPTTCRRRSSARRPGSGPSRILRSLLGVSDDGGLRYGPADGASPGARPRHARGHSLLARVCTPQLRSGELCRERYVLFGQQWDTVRGEVLG